MTELRDGITILHGIHEIEISPWHSWWHQRLWGTRNFPKHFCSLLPMAWPLRAQWETLFLKWFMVLFHRKYPFLLKPWGPLFCWYFLKHVLCNSFFYLQKWPTVCYTWLTCLIFWHLVNRGGGVSCYALRWNKLAKWGNVQLIVTEVICSTHYVNSMQTCNSVT